MGSAVVLKEGGCKKEEAEQKPGSGRERGVVERGKLGPPTYERAWENLAYITITWQVLEMMTIDDAEVQSTIVRVAGACANAAGDDPASALIFTSARSSVLVDQHHIPL